MSTRTTDLPDGVIIRVYHFCDDWCAYCPVTARCTSHRIKCEREAASGPDHADTIEGMVEFTKQVASAEGLETPALDAVLAGDPTGEYRWAQDDDWIADAAVHFGVEAGRLLFLSGWRCPAPDGVATRPSPLDVIAWYHMFIALRIHRTLTSAARSDRGVPGEALEALGTGRLCLVCIERVRAALNTLARGKHEKLVRHLLATLDTITAGLEARVPGARAFMRPGLDAAAV